MKQVVLGQSGLSVSHLSLGTDTGVKPDTAGPLLKRAFDLGVSFWDTDETYRTLPAVRQGLQLVDRSKVVLAAKTYATDYDGARASLKNSLAELGTGYVDLFLLHAVDSPGDFEGRSGALRALLEAKEEGLVRAVGLSTHAVSMAGAAAAVGEIEVVLAVLNRAGAQIKDGDREQMASALQRVYIAGKGVYLMKVLDRGKLAGELDAALDYALQFPYAHSVCVGMKSTQQLEANVTIANRSAQNDAR